ncbi:MAG: hypothetical protein ACR652_08505 [Methylocystis sp.]|uniref:hypothetical protein n=1 Tax=Methylocystis sp. TaxID=1911079 RepID=UPI003DA4FE5F
MVASQLMEKRRPTYDLDAIKQAIGSVDRLDVYDVPMRGLLLCVKFQADVLTEFTIVLFKEK